ncbi:MAG: ABC transporter permease [Candidatus Dormibacterales bacterium]
MAVAVGAVGWRLRELVRYRELVANLVVRDLKLKYRRSVLGAVWSLLNPLIMMAIYTAVFNVILRVGRNFPPGYHYWAFVLVGLVAWLFFVNSLSGAVPSLAQNSNLIRKVYFPIEALTISSVVANLVNFLITLAALLIILLVWSNHLGLSLVLLPVVVLAEIGFALGLSLLVASLTVYFRDLEHLVGLGLTALFYLTPVFYPLDTTVVPAIHKYGRYLEINPMTWYIDTYHHILFRGDWPNPKLFGLMLASSVIALVAGYAVFVRLRPRLPEEV